MRLISYGPFGSERAAFLDGDKIIDLEQAMKAAGAERPVSDMRLFLEQSDWRSTLDRAHAARTRSTTCSAAASVSYSSTQRPA